MRKLRWEEYFSIPVMVILVTASLLFVPPPADAYSVPNTIQSGWIGALTFSVALTVANAGDLIVVNFQLVTLDGAVSLANGSVSDTQGNVYHHQSALEIHRNTMATCNLSSCLFAGASYATALASGVDTIMVTTNSGGSQGNIQAVDVVGLPSNSLIDTANGNGTNSVFNTATSVVTTGRFADASVMTACEASNVLSPGAGYTIVGAHLPFDGDSEYSVSPPASPTNFSFGCSASTLYFEVGATFGTPPAVVIVVTPCTAFQLQCWWFPFYFFGIYMVLIVGMAYAVKIPAKDMVGLLLESFSLASLLAVMLGIINVMFPLIITIVQVVRAIRE